MPRHHPQSGPRPGTAPAASTGTAPGAGPGAAPHRALPTRPAGPTLDAEACHSAPPRLSFLTRPLPEELLGARSPDLLGLLQGRDDVASWVHQGRGLIGLGRALTLTARGPRRIEALRSAWRAVVYASWWRDPLVRPGTGPVALGSITFSPASAQSSVLLVPRVLVGLDGRGAWATTAVPEGREHPGLEEILAAPPLEAPAPAPGAPARPGTAPPPGSAAAGAAQPSAAPAPLRPPAGAGPRPCPSTIAPAAPPGRAIAPGLDVHQGSLSREEWQAAVIAAQERMRRGEAGKVVLARDLLIDPPPAMTTGDLLARLGRAYPTCWTFAVDGMVGASPEMLVRLEDRRLFSRVLAGTARVSRGLEPQQRARAVAGLAEWLRASGKNTREHALARASVLEALEPLCSAVEAQEPHVLELPNVLHLASDMRGVVAGDTGALSLVGALHPTAAVGGTPTAAATGIIESVEGMDRGRYAGPVGWVDWHGEGQWCIALRSAQLGAHPGEPLRVFGGCGIMPDSDPADELAETEAKMRPVLEALAALA
ncbi:chorismate-binding protein [Actinomyces bowdenii]|uniref:isochorismate synthase n=1 Tax=Actinomyces bowdenii TaxID=131109 RepID=UPI00214CCCA6|nr:chorismate-binding protein [Actinomyces bowdenii]MCR2052984.1 chorismate-binding protein [Actinomyces bowdenii]